MCNAARLCQRYSVAQNNTPAVGFPAWRPNDAGVCVASPVHRVQVLDNKLRDSEEKGYRLQQDLGALQREHEQLRETFDRMSNELASAASKNKMDVSGRSGCRAEIQGGTAQ